jgi:Protein of unknown function (DUF3102)
MTIVLNSLADLAARIKAEHQATLAALKSSLGHAMAAGDLLIEAKARVKHGEWLLWFAEHCAIPERTAQTYMRLARNRAEIEAKSANSADLTMGDAIALLAKPEETTKETFLANKADEIRARVASLRSEIDKLEHEPLPPNIHRVPDFRRRLLYALAMAFIDKGIPISFHMLEELAPTAAIDAAQ